MTETVPVLEVRDLRVEFRSNGFPRTTTTALDGVSMTLQPGETLGIVGQSGSGKSTLARAIVGLEKPTSGDILVDGHALGTDRASLRRLRSTVQMVFQDSLNSLNPRRTIGSTLAEPILVHRVVPASGVRARVAELLADVGLDPAFAARRPSQLSGGQRQRVNIARALASEPKMVIADEPTSALDVSVRAQILELLGRLQRERGLSMLFISHDLNVVRHMSGNVMVMRHGVVVESAPTAQLYAAPAHEYTRELLAATPTLDEALARRLARATGTAS